ncbi:unnamed protein product [Penicillium pancosmium]
MAAGIFNSTYYGKDYRAGAALLRARRPFLVKNALTGFGLFAFTIGVCTYSLIGIAFHFQFSALSYNPDVPAQREDHTTRRLRPNPPHPFKPTISFTKILLRIKKLTIILSTDAYTIKAVGQEEFSDVKVPETPASSEKK